MKTFYGALRDWIAGGDAANWHYHRALRPVKLNDGTTAHGDFMRRWNGRKWVYRRPTPAELMTEIRDRAW